MARRILSGMLFRPAAAGVSVAMLLAGGVLLGAQSSGPRSLPNARCYDAPEKFAIEFFKYIEMGPLSRQTYENAFALEFKKATPFEELQGFVKETHARFGIDRYDRPLDTRLVGPPFVERFQSKRPSPELSVTLLAFTSRGQAQLRAELLCEDQFWKVMRFSYEPGKY